MEEKQNLGEQKLTLKATVANIETVTDFVNEQLKQRDCPMKAQMQIDVAIDELFGNIAHYAYQPDTGLATVCVQTLAEPNGVAITFIDSGKPYNPLERENPNISLSASEREIGGLGIFMAKKLMDKIGYEYQGGQNRLTIIKYF